MAKIGSLLFLALLFFGGSLYPAQRDIAPFVTTDWLEQRLGSAGLVIVDLRSTADYRKSHIPGSVNSDAGAWAANRNGLLRELPEEGALISLLGSLGISPNSKVIAVGKGSTDFDRADPIRVAWTLLAAGVKNVSVLDGGFSKWLKDKKTVSVDPFSPAQGTYGGKVDHSMEASKKYVQRRIGKSVIVDSRNPEMYFGIDTEPWAPQPGHIPGAVNLPTPWIFNRQGILRSRTELDRMASAVIGSNKSKEYILYCGVGPYANAWAYVMTEVLGYKNVKVYDGSMQEWIMEPAGPVSLYGWR